MPKLKLDKIILLLLMMSLLSNLSFAQTGVKYSSKSKKAIKNYEEATHFYDAYNNTACIESLNKALKEDSNFLEAYYLLAAVYKDKKEIDNAINAYEKAIGIDENFYPGALYAVANIQLSNGRYENAGVNFEKYLEQKSEPIIKLKAARKALEIIDFAMYQMAHPVPFNLVNMGGNVNSKNDEYLPAITADEQTLVITVARPRDEQSITGSGLEEDFYISQKIKGEWTKAEPIGPPLNTHGNEGAQCISPDGQQIYFTACNRDDGYGRCDIYYTHKLGNTWTIPVNLGEPVNTSAWESQPSISSDGKTLYFTSARPGGKGGMDIWKTILNEDGKWGVPINLGDSVNTRYNEESPFIHPDNQTLYFTSDGRMGMGGRDIYYCRKNALGEWGRPVNLGYPINTYADEVNLVVNAKGDLAYFSSDKPGGFGKLDLYNFELYPEARPLAVNYLKGKVYDKENMRNLEAKFELINLETGEVVVQSKSNALTGEFLLCLPVNKNYALNISKDGYLFYSENFALEGNHSEMKPFLKDLPLQPIQIGESVVLRNVFFETDNYELKPESKIELAKLLTFLKQNPRMKIEISGHTDHVGTEKYNLNLSENRAKSVYDYLIANAVASTRLTYKGYGWAKPVDSNDTEIGKANNRRTEFKVIGN
ncbi:MAG: OmpA family protein [Bacteroidota bacterium]